MTTIPRHTWEARLLQLAGTGRPPLAEPDRQPLAPPDRLRWAYAHCQAVTRSASRSFYLASALLPPRQRQSMRALYAVCRTSDDLVDSRQGPEAWAAWRARVLAPTADASHGVLLAWADTRRRFNIPSHYVEQLLDGVARDLTPHRLETFDDLAHYAYGVAATVGLMSMYITGFTSAEAVPFAIKLGVALQVTNILRDVGEDWRAGRLYLPTRELEAFGFSPATLAAGQVNDRWRAFMRFQISRNRQLYAEAWPGIQLLQPEGRLAVTAAATLYGAILRDIEAHDYQVFHRRAYVSAAGKLARLPGIWWNSRRPCPPLTL